MSIAAIDLSAESWHLMALMIAIWQPLLVLLLIAGFVLACAHLLTMIGTRWGDRRVSSKAFSFSITVHVLLACGLIALIPEYRVRALMRLSDLQEDPIQILTTFETSPEEVERSRNGATPIWEQIPQSESPDWQRFQSTPQMTVETVRPHPLESPRYQPDLTGDTTVLPAESRPVPEQPMRAESGALQEAAVQMALTAIEKESRPETELSSASRARAPRMQLGSETETTLNRPEAGQIDLLSPDLAADRRQPDLTDMISPEASLSRSREDELLAKRQGPAPASSSVERLGLEDVGEKTSRNSAPVEPALSRLRTRNVISDNDLGEVRPFRPDVTPILPEATPSRMENSLLSRDDLDLIRNDRPELARREDAFMTRSERDRTPSAYRLRADEHRERALLQYGGSEESEAAVDRALKWLASMQTAGGYWDANATGAGRVGIDEDGIDRKFAGRHADAGLTALAVLAFLGKQNTLDEGEYSAVVNRALRWLVSQQRVMTWPGRGGTTDGFLGGNASEYAAMYCHGMATFAIAEAYAMSRTNVDAQWLREPLRKGVHFILETQLADGGWRYVKGQPDGDMSMFGWQLMALKSAEAAGIDVPEEAKARMRKFLNDRRMGQSGGLAGYRANDPPTAAMTAEALFCRQMLGMETGGAAATREAAEFLLANAPRRTTLNYYYWYYGTLAMHQHGGDAWTAWNSAMRDLVISEQRQSGPLAGSWDPRDVWGGYGGRVYSTAVATLSLEVYYRYLPLYRLHESP